MEAIDKKSNFPAPKLRQRQHVRSSSTTSAQSPTSPSFSEAGGSTSAVTSGADAGNVKVTVNGATKPIVQEQSKDKGKDKGKGAAEPDPDSEELTKLERQRVISPELRGLLSRKVEVLPHKVVRRDGEGLESLKGKGK